MSSLSKASFKQYNVVYHRWINFCSTRNYNVYSSSITIITEFLSTYFTEGVGYSSLNTARSALSLILPDIDGKPIGCHSLVKRMLQGAAKLKPPNPRFSYTWDPSKVVAYLATLFPHDNLSLEQITIKCITGLSLITAHRTQTLSLIRLDQLEIKEDRIQIYIPDLVKTSKPGRLQPLLVIPRFSDKPEICVMNSLTSYLKKTEVLRTDTDTKLFIGLTKPHKAVGSQTISRWIRRGLQLSGIDINQFKSHSVRSSATSAAARGGITLDQIRLRAGWTDQSDVFRIFYDKPLENSCDFGKSIFGIQ